MEQMRKFLNKAWEYLNGNKTLIGFVALYMDQKYLSNVGGWYVETIRILLYIWTGIGTIHKGYKYGRSKNYFGKVPSVRQPDDSV